jgi:hypothetical protein
LKPVELPELQEEEVVAVEVRRFSYLSRAIFPIFRIARNALPVFCVLAFVENTPEHTNTHMDREIKHTLVSNKKCLLLSSSTVRWSKPEDLKTKTTKQRTNK